MTSCSIYVAIDTVINGDGTWGGFSNLSKSVVNITQLLPSAMSSIQTYFPDTNSTSGINDSWIVNSMTTMQNTNLNFYTKYKSSTVDTTNPSTTATATIAGQGIPQINSMFIKNGLGPNGTSNTMVTDIDLGLRTTSKVTNQLSSFLYRLTRLSNQQPYSINPSIPSLTTLNQV